MMSNAWVPPLANSARHFVAVVTNVDRTALTALMSYGSHALYREFFTVYLNTATKGDQVTQSSGLGYRLGLGSRYQWDGTDPFYYPTSLEGSTDGPMIISASHDATTTKMHRNGRQIMSEAITWNTTNAGAWWVPLTIGGFNWGAHTASRYDLMEFFAFDTALSDADQQTLTCYLATRYNLTSEISSCRSGPLLLQSDTDLALKVGSSQQLYAHGGTGVLTWSGSVVSSTGLATASVAGTSLVTVADQSGAEKTITVRSTNYKAPSAWFAADQITGLTDGQTVQEWRDLSGQKNHAQQMRSANRPTYRTGIINGLPIVRFAGSHCLISPARFIGDSTGNGATLLAVVTNPAVALGQDVLSIGVQGGWGILSMTIGDYAGATLANWDLNYNGEGTDSNVLVSTHTKTLVLTRTKSPNDEIWVNGTLQTSRSNVGPVATDPNSGFFLGSRGSTARAGTCWNKFLSADLAEVMVWDSWISDADRAAVETYLKAKYAIP